METVRSENRVAIISMIISDNSSVEQVNRLLHEYSGFIRGRMGIPYPERGLNIISIVADTTQDNISALSGKLGRLPGVKSKAVYN